MKLFELYKQPITRNALREDKTLNASIKLCEGIISLLEASYEGGIDFEPQPAYAGVKGISRDTGYGEDDRRSAEKKQQNIKLNQTWQRLVRNLNKLDAAGAEKLKVNLKKVADVAKQKGFQLSPTPEEVLGR